MFILKSPMQEEPQTNCEKDEGSKEENHIDELEEGASSEEQASVFEGLGSKSVDDIPEFIPKSNIDAVNTMPLDPASTNLYPQSSPPMFHPYYPMVFTPQTLPPNTSIIPLAGMCVQYRDLAYNNLHRIELLMSLLTLSDLYYNENYAGLAAELFGITESPPPASIVPNNSMTSDENQPPFLLPSEDIDGDDPNHRIPDQLNVCIYQYLR